MSCAQGIALSADSNYKVLGSAYPWIAQRLLSDRSPELQETLRALLYKGSKFQFGRLESLLRQAVKAPPRAATITGSTKRATSPGEHCNFSLSSSHYSKTASYCRSLFLGAAL